ncbi:MAG: DUF4302 domain-containing protein [Odoribacteraceae bacterium]|jgi:hypothetical protein|nr:DUF4302 domain-containing protein [Odoribacteraceae bacterium]
MKHLLYLALALTLAQGCVPTVEDIFDAPASERIAAQQKAWQTRLVNAENGWLADYYPDKKAALGGYAMHIKFYADGTTDVACERETNAPAGAVATSEYALLSEQSILLSFNTYNKVMHFFSEPKGQGDVDGWAGDYEFVFMKGDDNTIELQGKKWGRRLVMRRCDPAFDFDAYINDVNTLAQNIADTLSLYGYGLFIFQGNGQEIATAAEVDRAFSAYYTGATGQDTTLNIPYIKTPEGLRLYEPVTLDGSTFENLAWDFNTNKYVCTDPGSTFEVVPGFPPDYELKYAEFLGRWRFECGNGMVVALTPILVDTAIITAKRANVTFNMVIPKIFPHPVFELEFDAMKGTIALVNQAFYITDAGNEFRFVYSYLNGTSFYTQATVGRPPYGLAGKWNHDEGDTRVIQFTNNGRSTTVGQAYGFSLRAFTTIAGSTLASTDNSPGFYNGYYVGDTQAIYGSRIYRYYNIKLTKIDD